MMDVEAQNPSERALGANSPIEPLLNILEVARILRISEGHAYKLAKRGALPSVRIGQRVLVRPGDLRAFIERSLSVSVS